MALALVGTRLICSESLSARQLGVLFMKGRDYMDGLDGWTARKRNAALGFAVRPDSSGYYMDGACDAIAYIVYIWGEILLLLLLLLLFLLLEDTRWYVTVLYVRINFERCEDVND